MIAGLFSLILTIFVLFLVLILFKVAAGLILQVLHVSPVRLIVLIPIASDIVANRLDQRSVLIIHIVRVVVIPLIVGLFLIVVVLFIVIVLGCIVLLSVPHAIIHLVLLGVLVILVLLVLVLEVIIAVIVVSRSFVFMSSI